MQLAQIVKVTVQVCALLNAQPAVQVLAREVVKIRAQEAAQEVVQVHVRVLVLEVVQIAAQIAMGVMDVLEHVIVIVQMIVMAVVKIHVK